MLYAFIIRSPVSQGRLEGIECPALPGSITLISAADIPGINELDDFPIPIFASETINYTGEAVALLAGPDLADLESIAAQCKVKISEEPPANPADKEVYLTLNYHQENTEKPLSSAHLVIDGSYNTGFQEHWYSEPHGALAFYTGGGAAAVQPLEEAAEAPGGALVLHTATQWPFHVKRSISKVLNINDSMIELKPAALGHHLDGKLWYPSLISCMAALGAFITKKPVKLMLSRTEDFRWSPKRNCAQINFASILGKSNELLETVINVTTDLGSYGVFSGEILSQTCLGCMGIYHLGEVNLEGTAQKTAIPPQGPFEGFGISQGFFASERHVSRIADSLHIDPGEWRKKNCITKNENLAIGIPLKDNVPIKELIDSAASMSDYYRKWASYELLRSSRRKDNLENVDLKNESKRGIGIATAFQGSGSLFFGNDKGAYGVELTLEKDGTLDIKSSIIPKEEHAASIWRSLASAILGIGENHINIVYSEKGPDSGPECHSRYITGITRLVERCCDSIRKQRFRDPLPITVRRFQRPNKIIAWNGQNGEQYIDANAFAHPAWGAAVAEIEIDQVSLAPMVRGIWLVAEGGKILSQTRARRSLKIAAIQALNWASREEVIYENGIIPNNIIRNYGIPSPGEIPPIHIDFLWNDSAEPKGIGELPYSCIPAAYIQAVSQAMDLPFDKIPISARDVREAERNKKVEISL